MGKGAGVIDTCEMKAEERLSGREASQGMRKGYRGLQWGGR